ncbi:DUF2730 family protein [Leisingera sp. NJS201]|uniref:DUF2730 family protein n=1 Tax=Leisingera sp. NJS201 TaxID=2508306 RepID=UPI0010708781|nr:DUF2730 family protein [Leisingera sp. NJS201]QBR36042.1 DUF2730 family protein [Leisingera sp. NJS201]
MEFDPTFTWSNALALVTFAGSLGTAVYVWISGRRTNVDERFKQGSDRMDRHENRLISVEQSIKSMPTREDVHKIELAMERINGTMGRMEAVLEGNQQIMGRLENVVTRHEDHLLNGSN